MCLALEACRYPIRHVVHLGLAMALAPSAELGMRCIVEDGMANESELVVCTRTWLLQQS